MSEYQYYEFRTVRRPLTREEQAEVNTWSSRGNVSATGASFTYHYSSFRQDPERCLLRCFDMMLYLANWGHRRLMFRFPEKEVDFQSLLAFQWDRDMEGSIQVYKKSGYIVVDIKERLEEGFDNWVEGEGVLPALTPLWTDIFKGNYACLYLLWLHFEAKCQEMMEEDGEDDDFEGAAEILEPPVPAGMKNASAALAEFMKFWDISEDLLSAAAAASPHQKLPAAAEIEGQIRQFSEQEKTTFLTRLLLEEPAAVQMDLQKRLLQASKNTTGSDAQLRRPLKEIVALAKQHAERRSAEAKRKSDEKRLQELNALEKRQLQAWASVWTNLAKRTGSGYDHAVTELEDLRDLALHLDKKTEFDKKMAAIRVEFGKSKPFLERLVQAGLT